MVFANKKVGKLQIKKRSVVRHSPNEKDMDLV